MSSLCIEATDLLKVEEPDIWGEFSLGFLIGSCYNLDVTSFFLKLPEHWSIKAGFTKDEKTQ